VFSFKEINNVFNNGTKDLYKVSLGYSRSVKCTLSHKFLTTTGWKPLLELKKGDLIINSNVTNTKSKECSNYLTEDQLQVVFGSQLGDGYIEYSNEYKGRLKMIHGIAQKEYLEWKNNLLFNSEMVYVEKNGYSQKEAYIVQTTKFFFNYTYEDVIDKLDLLGLAVLWLDDGSLSKLQNSGTLYSLCDKKDLITKLNIKINKLCNINGIVSSFKKNEKILYYIRYRKACVQTLSTLICRYVPLCMEYKICNKDRENVGSYQHKPKNNFQVSMFYGKTFYKHCEAFDLEVQDYHNYIVCSQNSLEGEVVHNCHFGYDPKSTSSVSKFLKAIGIKRKLGMTATPYRTYNTLDGSTLKVITKTRPKAFQDICYNVNPSYMVENGFWSRLDYKLYDFDATVLKLNTSGTDYTDVSVYAANKANGVNNNAFVLIKKLLASGVKGILVFTDSIETSETFVKHIPNSASISYKTPTKERIKIISDFKKGIGVDVIFNKGILDTGFNKKDLEYILVLRPVNMVTWAQLVGRGTRLSPGKTKCTVMDMCGNFKTHGAIEELQMVNTPSKGWDLYKGDTLVSGIVSKDIGKYTLVDGDIDYQQGKGDKFKYYKMEFGKHKGKPLVAVPKHYLEWLITTNDCPMEVRMYVTD